MAESSGADNYDITKDPKRKAKSNDPGWKYGYWPDMTNKDIVQCILCGKKCHSGIKRLKQHLAGNYGDVAKCPKTSTEIMREMQLALNSKKRNKPVELDDDNDDDDVVEVQAEQSTAPPTLDSNASSNTIPSSGTASKTQKAVFQFQKPQPKATTKSIDSLLRKTPEEVVQDRHSKRPGQTTIENRLRTPEEKERVHMHIANFFYECGIPFNAANTRSYEVMIESIGQYGQGLKPPTYHELRVPLLEKAKKQTDELKAKHEVAWKQYGCTLMSDGWTDRRGRHLLEKW